MIEINIHLPIDDLNTVSIPIYLPVVPRVGERIYLSHKQQNDLTQLEEAGICNSQECKKSIRQFTVIEEVGYNAEDGTVHIELSTI